MSIYRAWVNQPSTLQPLHSLHGIHCIVHDTGEKVVTLYFTEGDLHSTTAFRECISKIHLSKVTQC
jgi:hypothetical protein